MEVPATPLATQDFHVVICVALFTLHLSWHIAVITVQNITNLVVVELSGFLHCKSDGVQNLILVLRCKLCHVGNEKLDKPMKVHSES